jgi:type I restriction enzyme S subunit
VSNYQLSINNYQLPEGYKQTEVGVIPEEWEVYSVGQMGEVVTGKALAVNAPGKQRPYLRTKNVFDGQIDIEDVLTMPMTDAQFEHFMILNGDVLLNEGQTLELVGRCAIYQDEYPEPCAMQNQLIRFRAKTGVSSVFASHLFRFCQQTGVFSKIALQTTSVAHLGSKRFENLPLPWPKAEKEQCAIATALSDVDALIAALDKLIAKKRHLKTATMQQLLTGKQRLPGFGEGKGYKQTEVGLIPEDWEMKDLGDVGEFKNGINKGSGDFGHGSPFVNLMDVFDISSISKTLHLGLVNSNEAEQRVYNLIRGDVLFVRSSVKPSGVGLTTVVVKDLSRTVYSGFLIRFRDNGNLDTGFKQYCFSEDRFRQRVIANSTVSANTNINQENLKKLPKNNVRSPQSSPTWIAR